VTIRLLDPPLHEFLPQTDEEIDEVARAMGAEPRFMRCGPASTELHEFNPMLGHRGCRLLISYPEIAEMQARAIFEAAVRRCPPKPASARRPEIMVPLVGLTRSFDYREGRIVAWPRGHGPKRAWKSSISSAR
jgi:pyruvate,orthophosphate dikinase